MKKILFLAAIFPVIYFSLTKINSNFSYASYKDITSTLLIISGMVFTIMGIWIAFLYPNALLRLTNTNIKPTDFSESSEETKRLEAIVGSIIKSSLIPLTILAIFMLKAILSGTTAYLSFIQEIKTAALTTTIYLCYFQVETIGQVIYANVSFLNDLHSKKNMRNADKQL